MAVSGRSRKHAKPTKPGQPARAYVRTYLEHLVDLGPEPREVGGARSLVPMQDLVAPPQVDGHHVGILLGLGPVLSEDERRQAGLSLVAHDIARHHVPQPLIVGF